MDLTDFNAAPPEDATKTLLACCDAPEWAAAIRDARPYADEDELLATAERQARSLSDDEVARALAAHPRIGERVGGWSGEEQSGVAPGDDVVEMNRAYEQRFGRVFLICATGLSADEIIAAGRERLGHDDATEAAVVRDELRKIAILRLRKVLAT